MHLTKRVISVCTLKHRDVWQLTSELLPRFLVADEFIVYVPEVEVEEFKKFTNKKIQVLSENSMQNEYLLNLRNHLIEAKNESRFGWYFQQFLKIEALSNSPSDVTIIWDADCVPVKEINVINASGEPMYMKSNEFHQDYFSMIERLIGISKSRTESFIVPAFPMPKSWIKEFLTEIEIKNGGIKWHEALINSIDFKKQSGFSEFELLGTWASNFHSNQIHEATYSWERFGQSKFGQPTTFTSNDVIEIGINNNLDIISFEIWDKKNFVYLFKKFLTGLFNSLK